MPERVRRTPFMPFKLRAAGPQHSAGNRTLAVRRPHGDAAAVIIRPLEAADAPELAELRTHNHAFLAPFEPYRADDFATEAGQTAWIESGGGVRFAIVHDGAIAGTISLSDIVRGPLQRASVGYWVAEEHNGRGLASRALAELVDYSFGELELHRLEAGTMLDNEASQRVLRRNGFTE